MDFWVNRSIQAINASFRFGTIPAEQDSFDTTRFHRAVLPVINLWMQLPIELRMIVLALLGIAGGAFANYLIYTWSYFPRPISPWAPPHTDAPPRESRDRIPVLGWFGLRREKELHGRGFWVRPVLIELAMGIALPALYWYEALSSDLIPAGLPAGFAAQFEPWGTQIFFGHAILLVLMVAATFIDFDEQTIPDIITIPGTIIALILASCSLTWFLPGFVPAAAGGGVILPITFEHPWVTLPWAPVGKWAGQTGLMTGLAIWSGWCFALADRRVILRKGFAKAIEFFFAGLVRYRTWILLVGIWVVGLIGITIVHAIGGTYWWGLFSALVGLAIGGGIVWGIRIVASVSLGVEAMGFGDVTLMAMIGAFLGWQASLISFFLAPFTAIVIVIIQYAVTRNRAVPFGPYLCAGTLLTILYWDAFYTNWLARNLMMMGPWVMWFGLGLLVIMGVMLFVWRIIKESILGIRR